MIAPENRRYMVNEVFYSLQGEGVRAGTMNVFIRFTGCNMRCELKEGIKSPGGFDCDTEFESGRALTLEEIAQWCCDAIKLARGPVQVNETIDGWELWKQPWIILTGGEPGLWVDQELVRFFHARGCKLAIETNGSIDLKSKLGITIGSKQEDYLDWITVSPKVAEHCIKQLEADEVKYVRAYGQGIPKTVVKAQHKLISPAFEGGVVDPKTLEWCVRLVWEHPDWRLSIQQHKTTFGGVR